MEIKDLIHKTIFINSNANFRDAIIKMQISKINSLIVVDDDGYFVGIVDTVNLINAIIPSYFGERECKVASIVTEELLEGYIEENKELPVKDFMLEQCAKLYEDSSLMEIFSIFIQMNLSIAPVVDDDNKPIGVITREGIRKLFVYKLGIEKNVLSN